MARERGLRVLIIGCGYVGMAAGRALARAGAAVVGTTTREARCAELAQAGITPRVLDVADGDAVARAVAGQDVVILSVAAGRRDRPYDEVYGVAARHLACALAEYPVARVIYTSSTSVYAQDDGSWVDESSPTEPTSANGRVLLAAERTLLDAPVRDDLGPAHGVSIVRLAGIYGPGRDPRRFVERFSGRERDDGNGYLNLVHRADIVAALERLTATTHHGVLNLSDDMPQRRREVFDPILVAAGLPPVRWVSPPSGGLGKRVSNRRIKTLLGMTLQYPRYGQPPTPDGAGEP
jgi:nucleoside-diphosphate-sugar epimerase